MSKKQSTSTPVEMEGGVSRAVDFNLKKEDLMLLILEGRKESMEEKIAEITTISTNLRKVLHEKQNAFTEALENLCYKELLNKDAVALAKGFTKRESEDEKLNLKDAFEILLVGYQRHAEYTRFVSSPIGDGKGSTYIKQQKTAHVTYIGYNQVKFTLMLSLHGKNYGKPHALLANAETRACTDNPYKMTILNEALSSKFVEEMKEFKEVKVAAEALAKNESFLSDILAEYDLFNRNQPRAKAKMIKEVLGADENGKALLANITAAAANTKLLA